ncbi:MAG: GNAT family N-acetyltransferase [Myxococcota bacterium]
MIELLAPSEADAALALVLESFDAAVAPDYSAEGAALFRRVVTADYLRSLPARNGFTLVERDGERLVGLCAVRDHNHLTLFFVRPDAQGRGVGRRLFDAMLARVRRASPAARDLEVQSSPVAVPVYEALGFHRCGAELDEGGIRSIPMTRPL